MVKVAQYESEDGKVPFKAWFSSLDTKAALKVRTAVAQMEAGNYGDHKSVGSGVWERRIHFAKGYRVYFAKDGVELILLLSGGIKARQQSDIDMAKEYWSDYKNRKQRETNEREAKGNRQQQMRKGKK
ncbi:MAG: type II toxin-antitoxin system RelE/ParE family toxin [Pirellulaceae bacterium]|nr:type II toxin-antitoxin system RelE/ParE family toxin [Pirellulaceae bacterium]